MDWRFQEADPGSPIAGADPCLARSMHQRCAHEPLRLHGRLALRNRPGACLHSRVPAPRNHSTSFDRILRAFSSQPQTKHTQFQAPIRHSRNRLPPPELRRPLRALSTARTPPARIELHEHPHEKRANAMPNAKRDCSHACTVLRPLYSSSFHC